MSEGLTPSDLSSQGGSRLGGVAAVAAAREARRQLRATLRDRLRDERAALRRPQRGPQPGPAPLAVDPGMAAVPEPLGASPGSDEPASPPRDDMAGTVFGGLMARERPAESAALAEAMDGSTAIAGQADPDRDRAPEPETAAQAPAPEARPTWQADADAREDVASTPEAQEDVASISDAEEDLASIAEAILASEAAPPALAAHADPAAAPNDPPDEHATEADRLVPAPDADPVPSDVAPEPAPVVAGGEARPASSADASPALPLPGLGPGMLLRLSHLGIETTAQMAGADPEQLRRALGPISRLVDVEGWIAAARAAEAQRA